MLSCGEAIACAVFAELLISLGAPAQAMTGGQAGFVSDEAWGDAKILAVPTDKICPLFVHWKSIDDVPEIRLRQIQHFFEHYKDLEVTKWVKVLGWGDAQEAQEFILRAYERAKASRAATQGG